MRTKRSSPLPRLLLGAAVCFLAVGLGAADSRGAAKVGLIVPSCCGFGEETKDRFAAELRSAGVADAEIITQRPGTDKVSLVNSIRKLLAYDAGILVVFGGSAAKEAIREAGKLPVVFTMVYDPVREGLVKSLEQPGANVTGASCKTSIPFLFDNIREVMALNALGAVYHSDNLDGMVQLQEVAEAADKRDFKVIKADLKTSAPATLGAALTNVQAIYLASGCVPDAITADDLASLGKPVVTQCPMADPAKVLFTLAADKNETFAETARLTARIIKGEKPAGIAVATPKKIAFTVNLPMAQQFGYQIPFSVLSRATQIIK